MPNEPSPPPTYVRGNSFWQDASADLFRDPRAMKIGDVVTVKISIKDKAILDNTTERKRDNKTSFDLDTSWDTKLPLLNGKRSGTIDSKINSKSETKGEGAINRSESIELLVAAVVSDVLPNGNLIISGTQEVRVNFEVRVLTRAGDRAPARHLDREHGVLRQDRGSPHLLRRPRPHHRCAAAGLGPAAARYDFAVLSGGRGAMAKKPAAAA